MKNAVEARKNSFEPQYKSAMRDIERAIERGYTSTRLTTISILPEVAKRLVSEGYDVKIVISDISELFSHVDVSWGNAQKGKVGKIIYLDKTNSFTNPFDVIWQTRECWSK